MFVVGGVPWRACWWPRLNSCEVLFGVCSLVRWVAVFGLRFCMVFSSSVVILVVWFNISVMFWRRLVILGSF